MLSTLALNHFLGASGSSTYRYTVVSVHSCAVLWPARSGNEYRRLTLCLHKQKQPRSEHGSASAQNAVSHETVPSPLLLNVRSPVMASNPRWAALRLSCRWQPVVTRPYPCTDGIPRASPPDDLNGSSELNKVTNVPLGFDK